MYVLGDFLLRPKVTVINIHRLSPTVSKAAAAGKLSPSASADLCVLLQTLQLSLLQHVAAMTHSLQWKHNINATGQMELKTEGAKTKTPKPEGLEV